MSSTSKLILLLGPSGAGKTFVKNYLVNKYGFDSAPKYTTRKPRNSEDEKRDFIFCSGDEEIPIDNILKFESYGKMFGIQLDKIDMSFRASKNHVITVGDVQTIKHIKKLHPNHVKTILIYCDKLKLKKRLLQDSSTERAERWKEVEKEINGIYEWLSVVDYILDCSNSKEATSVKLDQLIHTLIQTNSNE